MGKIWVEIYLISARGLRRTSSLWKLQWFGVGWIDPKNKYCTKVDASGNPNPTWKTKFAALVDDSNFQEMALHVEVYSREPIFLRERLEGSATILLKEFLGKYSNNSQSSRPGAEEVGSYQLRKRNSNKPQGFIDVSIRVSEEKEELRSYPAPWGSKGGDSPDDARTRLVSCPEGVERTPYFAITAVSSHFGGSDGGLALMGHGNNITLSTEERPEQVYPREVPLTQIRRRPETQSANTSYTHPMPYPTDYSNPSPGGPSNPPAAGPSYHPQRTPPPPPSPPSNVGYIPTFLPNTDYINMPPSVTAPARGARPGLAMGVGAGALAAGAVIFGDDFMSGFDVPL